MPMNPCQILSLSHPMSMSHGISSGNTPLSFPQLQTSFHQGKEPLSRKLYTISGSHQTKQSNPFFALKYIPAILQQHKTHHQNHNTPLQRTYALKLPLQAMPLLPSS